MNFPIAPVPDWGTVEATVVMSSQMLRQTQTVEIEIIGEGSVVHRHTSVMLDLKTRAVELEFLNIIVDESPVIPYEIYRRYVAGSPRAEVTVSGDTIGPTFPGDAPVSLASLFPTGHGKFGKGSEFHLFQLAANTWQLHYLRLTNQLGDHNRSNHNESTIFPLTRVCRELRRTVFGRMNLEYTAVMRRFSSQGSLALWDNSQPSVWLTAWAVKILRDVSFQVC